MRDESISDVEDGIVNEKNGPLGDAVSIASDKWCPHTQRRCSRLFG